MSNTAQITLGKLKTMSAAEIQSLVKEGGVTVLINGEPAFDVVAPLNALDERFLAVSRYVADEVSAELHRKLEAMRVEDLFNPRTAQEIVEAAGEAMVLRLPAPAPEPAPEAAAAPAKPKATSKPKAKPAAKPATKPAAKPAAKSKPAPKPKAAPQPDPEPAPAEEIAEDAAVTAVTAVTAAEALGDSAVNDDLLGLDAQGPLSDEDLAAPQTETAADDETLTGLDTEAFPENTDDEFEAPASEALFDDLLLDDNDLPVLPEPQPVAPAYQHGVDPDLENIEGPDPAASEDSGLRADEMPDADLGDAEDAQATPATDAAADAPDDGDVLAGLDDLDGPEEAVSEDEDGEEDEDPFGDDSTPLVRRLARRNV